jgi:hypothetical protein
MEDTSPSFAIMVLKPILVIVALWAIVSLALWALSIDVFFLLLTLCAFGLILTPSRPKRIN